MSTHRSLIRSINNVSRQKFWKQGKHRILIHLAPCSNPVHTDGILFSGNSKRDYSLFLKSRQKWDSICIHSSFRCFSTGKQDDQEGDSNDKQRSDAFRANWIRELQSPPNIITTARILCTPLLSYWIITGNHKMALGGCLIAGFSDWVDGYLARNHGMGTTLGGYLDPVADKFIINTLSATLWYTGTLPGPLVALWFSRDFLLFFGSVMYVRSRSKDNIHAFDPTVTPLKVTPTMTSKVNTTLQFLTLAVGIVYPISTIPPEVLSGLCYLTGFTTIASGLSYLDMSAFSDNLPSVVRKDETNLKEKDNDNNK